jgi:hypothetical protein
MAIAAFIPVVLVVAIGLACLRWLPRGRKVGGAEPRCAACGYIVHGLPAPVCPECGSNLSRPNAIITTGRLPPGRVARSIAWSAFCFLAVFIPATAIWGIFIVPRLPQVRNSSDVVTLSRPVSGAYQSIEVRAHTHHTAYPGDPDPPPDRLNIGLTLSDGTIRVLTVDPATLHFRDTSVSGSLMSSTPLDANSLIAWLKSAGVQGEETQLKREMSIAMAQLHLIITPTQIGQPVSSIDFGSFGTSSSGSSNPLPWTGFVPLLLAAIVWAFGLIRILRRPSN